jgi:GTP-binding protein YchF
MRDVETIELELALADLETVEKRLDRATRRAKSGDKTGIAEREFFTALLTHLSDGKPARSFDIPATMQAAVKQCHLLTIKPVLYVANVDDVSLAVGNDYSARLESWAEESAAGCLRICGQVEAELSELEDEEKAAFLEDMGVAETGLYRLSRAAYQLLNLQTFFTAGDIEVKAWTIHRGDLAPMAAGEIHSDFESNFIRAEVIPFDQYVEVGGEAEAKARGVMRVEGKDYAMQDGDVVHFRVGV